MQASLRGESAEAVTAIVLMPRFAAFRAASTVAPLPPEDETATRVVYAALR